MMKKSVLILGFVGVLALSIGFMKDLQSREVFAQTEQSKVKAGQAFNNEGDVSRVVTVEEQEMRENNSIDERDYTTVITTEEQNMVENSTVQSGFVKQENGTGFFFEKVK